MDTVLRVTVLVDMDQTSAALQHHLKQKDQTRISSSDMHTVEDKGTVEEDIKENIEAVKETEDEEQENEATNVTIENVEEKTTAEEDTEAADNIKDG